jgi:poly-beta-1,6-N-acetyl-D-glucosamine synthase
MKLLPIIYLGYMFVSIYLLLLSLFLYFHNKKHLLEIPPLKKKYSVSFVVPAYNESETIADTIEHIFAIDYDKITEVIVVNDCSTDNTKEIVEDLQKKYPKLFLINNEKNLGNAAGSKNVGWKYATGELIAFVDADSYPAKDSLQKMIGYFEDSKVGAVTCPVLVRNTKTFLGKIQAIEYKVVAFTRKLLGYVGGIYVTPGPLALYRKKAIDEVGGFDEKNLTEDIEITWHLIANGWKREMPLTTEVSTTAPEKLKVWYKQRKRWTIGGIQCISKYKKDFMKKGMLGSFVLPFFIIQFFLGLLGLGVFFYLLITKCITNYLIFNYSIPANIPLLTMKDLFITPTFLDYLGIIMFVAGIIFTLFVLAIIKGNALKKVGFFNLLFYSIIYLTAYPFITMIAVYNYFKRENKW